MSECMLISKKRITLGFNNGCGMENLVETIDFRGVCIRKGAACEEIFASFSRFESCHAASYFSCSIAWHRALTLHCKKCLRIDFLAEHAVDESERSTETIQRLMVAHAHRPGAVSFLRQSIFYASSFAGPLPSVALIGLLRAVGES